MKNNNKKSNNTEPRKPGSGKPGDRRGFVRKEGSSDVFPGKKISSDNHTGSTDIRSSLPDPAEIKEIVGIISPFRINKLTPIGAFLSPVRSETEETNSDRSPEIEKFEILLPKNEFEGKELSRGNLLNAFIYLDSEDRPIATLKEPLLTIGGLALLKCSEVTPMGAFLQWGLIKDLFLPFKEQTKKIKAGDEALVTLYLDKSSRLCASMKIYKLLKKDSPYKPNDHVTGFVYELSDQHGAYVAVDNKYSAMIPTRELVDKIRVGETRNLRVSQVLSDGKLELSMREPGYLQLNDDCSRIYEDLKTSTKGFLPYHDKSESLVIKNRFNMTKNAFKRAIGHLYKQGLILIDEDGIRLKEKPGS